MNPIGVFGGTFDPIHYGHLRTAYEVQQALKFDEVRFVPCGEPPHRGEPRANSTLRLAMVTAAVEGRKGFIVDDREIYRDGPSYSVDTLKTLRTDFPLRSLGLIIGMDAFLGLPEWYQWREILELSHIVIAHRPGWRMPDVGPLDELLKDRGTHRLDDLHQSKSGHIYIHEVTQLEIASTDIRRLVRIGRSPRFLMPSSVAKIINESSCYIEK